MSSSFQAPLKPFQRALAITPSDVTLLPETSGIWVGGAGALSVTTHDGDVVLFSGIPAGTKLDLSVTQIRATGTTATLIVALW